MSDLVTSTPIKLISENRSISHYLLSAFRGLRNGIMTGTRIRVPYIFQAAVYALLFRDNPEQRVNKLKFVIKQMFFHGRNLGMFVCIYKIICFALRHMGVYGGLECWIAGAVGGYYAFGESKGISGAVNNQIVLYLFARGMIGLLQSGVERGIIPQQLNPRKPQGFRYLAAFSLALILYLTDYEENNLRRGFMLTMNNLYYESNSGTLIPPKNHAFIVAVVLISIFGYVYAPLHLDNILSVI
eukprot:TRINITY_DN170_c1_g3_i1.p1 TRINITY_DN170_c1_g3~~TRINITY_DN170_c1_g3_i1.p1  ORF type:complete len:242 (+),score=73.66 TRINITY_DN170_c1_g3_i1:179-904(+)